MVQQATWMFPSAGEQCSDPPGPKLVVRVPITLPLNKLIFCAESPNGSHNLSLLVGSTGPQFARQILSVVHEYDKTTNPGRSRFTNMFLENRQRPACIPFHRLARISCHLPAGRSGLSAETTSPLSRTSVGLQSNSARNARENACGLEKQKSSATDEIDARPPGSRSTSRAATSLARRMNRTTPPCGSRRR